MNSYISVEKSGPSLTKIVWITPGFFGVWPDKALTTNYSSGLIQFTKLNRITIKQRVLGQFQFWLFTRNSCKLEQHC